MKMLLVLLLLRALLGAHTVPFRRPSCYKRVLHDHSCHSIPEGMESLRRVDESLQDHFWEGEGCETICYCNFKELLCYPYSQHFATKIFSGP
uniref:Stimulator of chondrogenesis 1 n=1 Tax=Pavo cristatus TaxID=9049 RepID=A0A8C9EKL9_PAVCR